MGPSAKLTSAGGILALLDEEQNELKELALKKLNEIVNEFWPEIAESVGKIEVLFENPAFTSRELAALVASKVYYHLEQYSEAMNYALGAGKLFDVTQKSEYVDTLVAKCIDEYVKQRNQLAETKDPSSVKVNADLERIVLGIFDRCFADKRYKQALGIALDARLLDKVEQTIAGSDDIPEMLSYCSKLCSDVILNRDFRQNVLRLLVRIYQRTNILDYLRMSEILVTLDDSKSVADILHTLIQSNDTEKELMAYQVAFDLVANSSQQFISSLLNSLPSPAASSSDQMEIEGLSSSSSSLNDRLKKLRTILSGETTIQLHLEFLSRNNHTDLLILKNMKTAVENRSSVLHSATLFANALMHAGTTRDTFLRENLDYLSKATNWAKFSATAGLGVIHKGHLKEGLSLLQPYLPQPGSAGSPYSEGGALYALGLIHANHGAEVIPFLTKALSNASGNEIVQHGACLGLGLAAMATNNEPLYEELRSILYSDSAVAGEAAGIAIGLVYLGSGNAKALEEMLLYARETQHEKIIRGLAIGIALVMFNREEEADTLITTLLLDKDPILRYGAMYTIGLAFCGTANNSAIKRLLHIAVSDVSDDVRRAAVIALGFVLSRQPQQCPKVVSLLSESYNPHVRYGATLALGIACCGTASKEALAILEPMTSDSVDFVRQGALISLAMIFAQTSKALEPKIENIRKLFEEKLTDKHEELMCKFGAILAQGIIDAGGRNVTVSLHSLSGHLSMPAVVGLTLFTQYWYWYPLVHFVSLSFTPTAIICLNKDLKMPVSQFMSNAPPSLFAYPPDVTPPATVAPSKVSSAVLSVAKKKEQRDKKVEEEKKKKEGDAMEVEKEEPAKAPAEPVKKEEKKEPEPQFQVLQNPARVTLEQLKYISFPETSRYQPVKEKDCWGILLTRDSKPGTPEEFVVPTIAKPSSSTSTAAAPEETEPEPPEPFEYNPN